MPFLKQIAIIFFTMYRPLFMQAPLLLPASSPSLFSASIMLKRVCLRTLYYLSHIFTTTMAKGGRGKANADGYEDFGLCDDTNDNWLRLKQEILDWKEENPGEEFPKASVFKGNGEWDHITTDQFYYRYTKAIKMMKQKEGK